MRRAAKTDRNHSEIVAAFRKLCYWNVCVICNQRFHYHQRSKYCDLHKAEARIAQSAHNKTRVYKDTKVYGNCLQCGIAIVSYRTRVKKYCSYKCHLDSGGAIRAGKAAGTMTRKYGAKKDANHVEIVTAFKKMGAALLDLSTMGAGCPDLLVMFNGSVHFVDIKNPNTGYGKRGLNPRQKEWASEWRGGPVYLISTVEQVAEMVNGRLDRLKRFPE